MDPTQMTTQQVMMYAALFNAGIGLVVGLVPLILGFVKGNIKFGVVGFLACLVGGTILGIILSIPSMVVFSWLIIRGARSKSEEAGPTAGTE